jgi:hypothetical protein
MSNVGYFGRNNMNLGQGGTYHINSSQQITMPLITNANIPLFSMGSWPPSGLNQLVNTIPTLNAFGIPQNMIVIGHSGSGTSDFPELMDQHIKITTTLDDEIVEYELEYIRSSTRTQAKDYSNIGSVPFIEAEPLMNLAARIIMDIFDDVNYYRSISKEIQAIVIIDGKEIAIPAWKLPDLAEEFI